MNKKFNLHYLILIFALFFCDATVFSQEKESTITTQENISSNKPKTTAGKIWKVLWGDPLKSSVTAMPIGLHTDFEKHGTSKRSTINGLHEALYFAGNYKSVELAVFQNSFGDPVVALFYKRAWNFTKRFSVNVGAGIMYGYEGRLQYTDGIPFRDTWLIKGDINPVTGFELDYRFYKKWSVHTSIAPRIIIYGVRYIF